MGFYRFVKLLEFETANPGQDFNEKEAEAFHFDEDTAATGDDVSRPVVVPAQAAPRPSTGGSHTSQQDPNTLPGVGAFGSSPETSAGGAVGRNEARGNHSSRYDGEEGTVEPTRSNSTGTRENLRQSAERAYNAAPAAESGELGGRYRVSGL